MCVQRDIPSFTPAPVDMASKHMLTEFTADVGNLIIVLHLSTTCHPLASWLKSQCVCIWHKSYS